MTFREPSVCQQKSHLCQAFVHAVQQVSKLQSKNIEILMSRGSGMDRFELALQQARRRRDEAKRAYERHLREHCC